jgi:hypothetical protein
VIFSLAVSMEEEQQGARFLGQRSPAQEVGPLTSDEEAVRSAIAWLWRAAEVAGERHNPQRVVVPAVERGVGMAVSRLLAELESAAPKPSGARAEFSATLSAPMPAGGQARWGSVVLAAVMNLAPSPIFSLEVAAEAADPTAVVAAQFKAAEVVVLPLWTPRQPA